MLAQVVTGAKSEQAGRLAARKVGIRLDAGCMHALLMSAVADSNPNKKLIGRTATLTCVLVCCSMHASFRNSGSRPASRCHHCMTVSTRLWSVWSRLEMECCQCQTRVAQESCSGADSCWIVCIAGLQDPERGGVLRREVPHPPGGPRLRTRLLLQREWLRACAHVQSEARLVYVA